MVNKRDRLWKREKKVIEINCLGKEEKYMNRICFDIQWFDVRHGENSILANAFRNSILNIV